MVAHLQGPSIHASAGSMSQLDSWPVLSAACHMHHGAHTFVTLPNWLQLYVLLSGVASSSHTDVFERHGQLSAFHASMLNVFITASISSLSAGR
jgi:hypothetical protein